MRDVIESIRQMAEEGGAVPVPNPILAELCKAWLALDAAPEAKVYEGHDGYAEIMLEPYIEAKARLIGQHVRLVATPASGGPRE